MEHEAPGGGTVMKTSMKEVGRALLVVVALAVWTLSSVSDTGAQQAAGSLAQQIQGSWTLVSCVNETDGKKSDVFGPNPRGFMILTPDGRYSLIVMRSSLPKFASNSRIKGTDEENQAVVKGSMAHFGRYAVVNEKEQTVNFFVEGSTFPNWDNEPQKRIMSVSGDELRVTHGSTSSGSGTSHLIWKRTK
jgi:Lipocalin-like domain